MSSKLTGGAGPSAVAAGSRRLSLKGRLTAMTVGLVIALLWTLVILSATVVQDQVQRLLTDQQFAATQRIAGDLDNTLRERIEGLVRAAAGLPADLGYESLQTALANRPLMHVVFSGGIAVIGLDGRTIADYPVAPGRRGTYFGDRDYFRGVVASGKPYIDKPIIGRALKRPVLTIGVPVFGADGKLRAVMTGITDLTAPSFFGFVNDRAMTGRGEFFVFSLRDQMIIAATDGRRAMTAMPARGRNAIFDRMVDGFEGSGVSVSSEGIEKLYSGKRVPVADWLVLSALRSEIAFAPVRTMQLWLYVAAAVLTLAALWLIRRMAHGMLAPLDEAGQAMRRMTEGQVALAPLPVRRDDEVGQLIGSFNQLVQCRQAYEEALAESEQRFRQLVEAAPDAIFVQTHGRFVYLNAASQALFGAGSKVELLGESILGRVHPDCRAVCAERLRLFQEKRECVPVAEQVYLRLDGTPVAVEVSAVPFRYEDEDGSLVFVRDITERKRSVEALRQSEARFRSLFEHMLGGFAYCRMLFEHGLPVDFVYLEVNPSFDQLTGLHGVVGKRVSEVVPGIRQTNPELFDIYGRVAAGGPPERFETFVPGLDHWFSLSVYCPEPECFVAVFDVITERKRAELAQQRLNRALRLLSDCNMALVHAEREQSLLDEICRLVVESGGYRMAWVGFADDDPEHTVRPVARAGAGEDFLATARISWADNEFGRGPTGTAIRSGLVQVNHDFATNPATAPWREAAGRQGYRSSIALPLINGARCFGALTIYALAADAFTDDEVDLLRELAGDLAYGIETLRTRGQRELAEEKLAFLAHHDPLTGLPNRLLLRDRFERAAARAQREQTGVALMFLDLDNFKQVNDSLGHDMGDRLLVAVVERLQACIRDTDTISRQGGDEFIVLLGGVNDSVVIGRVAQQILDAVSEPFSLAGNTLNISFSIGISTFPNDGRDFDSLLKQADTALYHAKDGGRDTYHFFAAKMNVDALARLQLLGNLRNAVKNQEFLLHYQPQIAIDSGRIVGIEALVRWQPAGGGPLVPPGHFIPAAEQSGLIIAIGEWVLQEACRQAKAWQDCCLPPLVVAVNLSALQFRRGNILETVAAALASSGLMPQFLELELTESILLQDTDGALKTLQGLKEMGVKLSIDDFGTGYSSLSYLKRLAVDKLKIDQSFVRDIASDPDDAAIVRAIIQLGHTLQLSVIAEGVEDQRQLGFLTDYGCDEAQGYYFSRPLPAAQIEPLLKQGVTVERS